MNTNPRSTSPFPPVPIATNKAPPVPTTYVLLPPYPPNAPRPPLLAAPPRSASSSHPNPSAPPSQTTLPPPATRSLSFVPFGRLRIYMREEAKKYNKALQFRKESVKTLKEILDPFMRRIVGATLEVCEHRETNTKGTESEIRELYDHALGNGGSFSGFPETTGQGTGDQSAGQNKRKWDGEPEATQSKKRQIANSISSSSSEVTPPSTPPISPIDLTNSPTNKTTSNTTTIPTMSTATKPEVASKPSLTIIKQQKFRKHIPNSSIVPSSSARVADIVEQTNKMYRTIRPQDVIEALCQMHIEHLLLRERDVTPAALSPKEEEINQFFFE